MKGKTGGTEGGKTQNSVSGLMKQQVSHLADFKINERTFQNQHPSSIPNQSNWGVELQQRFQSSAGDSKCKCMPKPPRSMSNSLNAVLRGRGWLLLSMYALCRYSPGRSQVTSEDCRGKKCSSCLEQSSRNCKTRTTENKKPVSPSFTVHQVESTTRARRIWERHLSTGDGCASIHSIRSIS